VKKVCCLLMVVLLMSLCFVGCGEEPVTQEQANSEVGYFDGVTSTVLTADSVKKQVAAGTLTVSVSSGHSHDPNVDDAPAQGTVTLGMGSEAFCSLLQQGGFDTSTDEVRRVTDDYIIYRCFGVINGYYTNDERQNGLASVVYYDTAYGFEAKKTTAQQVKQVMGTPDKEGIATDQMTSMFLMSQSGATYVDYDCGTNHVTFYFAGDTNQLCATVIYQEGLWIL